MQNEAGRTELDILTHVHNTFSDPGKWTQGAAARNADGHKVNYWLDEATCFCVIGAIALAVFDLGGYTVVGNPADVRFSDEDTTLFNSTCEIISKQVHIDFPNIARAGGCVWLNDSKAENVEDVREVVRHAMESIL